MIEGESKQCLGPQFDGNLSETPSLGGGNSSSEWKVVSNSNFGWIFFSQIQISDRKVVSNSNLGWRF